MSPRCDQGGQRQCTARHRQVCSVTQGSSSSVGLKEAKSVTEGLKRHFQVSAIAAQGNLIYILKIKSEMYRLPPRKSWCDFSG